MKSAQRKKQKEYFAKHEYCESCGKIPHEVHEILHGSRRNFEQWNMISLCRTCHERAHNRAPNHGPHITQRMLFTVKKLNGYSIPEEIEREFEL
jgi:5-methylcytosine-specific restriction endonuclease McrA